MMADTTDKHESTNAQTDLRAAWDALITGLGRARDAIDDPRLYPPPPTDRNLAEGYRYLLGFLFGAIERALADPNFPYFRRAIQPVDKATIDNADAIYLCAPLDSESTYRVTGTAQDHRHWRGELPAAVGRKAPQYVILEATTAYAGDTGNLAELSPAVRTNTGTLDSAKLAVAADGSFEIVLAPQRPDGYAGNFMPTRREEHRAEYLVVRELFHDWEREDLLDLQIVRVASEGAHPLPLDPTKAAQQLKRVGEIVNNQMRFWNEFYAVILEVYGDMNGDGKRFMPRNDLNAPNFAAIQTGGGQSTNLYAGGIFELGEHEALVIEVRVPIPPAYSGFHLSNLWGESLDYANHISSLNAFQAEADADGAVRYVIAHRDPGVPNWLDTTGYPEGFMALRWTYSQKPDQLPTVQVMKVSFDEIRSHLPAGVRTVSAQERREQIRIRQEHVQRRYRQY
ncbi:MAG: DUF1214 domain-containing protein [Candidatus Binatia bacterium]